MTENKEQYPAYMEFLSNSSQIWSLFCGFTFATIAILITLLPDPSHMMSQVTLFSMAVLFIIFVFLIFFNFTASTSLYRISPKPQRIVSKAAVRVYNLLASLGWGLLSIQPILMFLLWNLVYLASATGIVYALMTILGYLCVWKPATERLRELNF